MSAAEEVEEIRVVRVAWQDTTGRLLLLSDGRLRAEERRGQRWTDRVPVNRAQAIRDRAILSLLRGRRG